MILTIGVEIVNDLLTCRLRLVWVERVNIRHRDGFGFWDVILFMLGYLNDGFDLRRLLVNQLPVSLWRVEHFGRQLYLVFCSLLLLLRRKILVVCWFVGRYPPVLPSRIIIKVYGQALLGLLRLLLQAFLK